MWPIYVLFNKFSRLKEGSAGRSDVNKLSLIGSFPFNHSPSDGEVYNHMVFSRSFSIEVPHINQLHNWDCGIACVAMVLKTLGFVDCNIEELEEVCCTRSVWTVDLAYLLQKYSVDFYYFTVTLGANPNFSVETFYKEQLPTDLVRVNMLFQKAREAGIDIECRSISGEEMTLLILSRNYIAIALVDQYKLNHSWLEDICVSSFCSDRPGYTGHYVIVCGYDADTDTFEIRDPASSQKHERVSSRCLEEARKSFGTDEDLLLICLTNENPCRLLSPLTTHTC